MYVSSVCSKYFIYSKLMLQVFYLDIAKVDADVAYTCMLQAYVSSVSYVCLQVFHQDVVYVCNGFQMFFRRFCKWFRRLFQVFHLSFFMLQLLHLDVLKVDRVLHNGCAWKAAGGVGDIQSDAGPLLVRSLVSPMH